jgi:hypothetical protein
MSAGKIPFLLEKSFSALPDGSCQSSSGFIVFEKNVIWQKTSLQLFMLFLQYEAFCICANYKLKSKIHCPRCERWHLQKTCQT